VAGALMFGVFFVAAAFGRAVNGVERTKWGHLLNIGSLIGNIWLRLFEGDNHTTSGAVFFRVAQGEELPLWCCWAALAALCLVCCTCWPANPRVEWCDERIAGHLHQRLAVLRRGAGHQTM